MAKRPPPGQCVHCLEEFEELTWDHVFPQGWYPDDTPEDLEKWKVPACDGCNSSYSEIERDLLIRFGMCFGPDEPGASGIADKVLRALDPNAATNERDRRAREAARNRVISEAKRSAAPPAEGLLPGMGPQPNVEYGGDYYLVEFPADDLDRLIEKIVRGLFYIQHGKFIELPYAPSIHFAEPKRIWEISAMIRRHGARLERGPGIRVIYAVPTDDPKSSIWQITIWGRLEAYAVVIPPHPTV